MKKFFLLLTLCACLWGLSAQEHPYAHIKGIWEGKLHISDEYSLTTVMVVKENGDSVHVELDSPDQYSTGIQLSGFSCIDSIINFAIDPLRIKFSGRLNANKTISGTFTQSGTSLPLPREKVENRKMYLRPQTPKLPYPYEEDFITLDAQSVVGNSKAKVYGTLTLPHGTPKATAILISGSGWQDRDETIYMHKPFLVIADHLTRLGYAVFRYDDLPPAVFAQCTTYDFAKVVDFIMAELAKHPRLEGSPIGLIGHSEGGLVAAMVAARNKEVAFVVSLAGMADNLKNTLLYQNQFVLDSNATAAQRKNSQKLNQGIYEIMENEPTIQAASTKFMKYIQQYTDKMTPEQIEASHLTKKEQLIMSQQLFNPWMFKLFKINPSYYFSKITCPLYALNGEKDTQVYYKTNLAIIQKYTKKNPQAQCEAIPNVNHLFQTCETGLFTEYGEISQTFNPIVLQQISYWLNQTINN